MARRRHRPRGQVQLLCPKCLSPEVDRNPILFGGPLYRCRHCGYEGALVLEQETGSGTDATGTEGGGA